MNTTDENKEQVDFGHKPNQYLIIESRSNLTACWIIHFTNGLLCGNEGKKESDRETFAIRLHQTEEFYGDKF